MQVSNINNNIIHIQSQHKTSSFKSGTQIKGTVIQVNTDGTIVLESDKGEFTAFNTSNFGLDVGDTVSLLITDSSGDGSAATTAITQINGQPIDQNVSLSEMHLINLGIMPNAQNMRMYNILKNFQLPLTKEYMNNLKDVFSALPDITDEQAAFLAANNIEPTLENLQALTNVGNLHQDISALLNESIQAIINEYGLSQEAVKNILNALNTITQNVDTPEIPSENTQVQQDTTLNMAALEQSINTAAFLEDAPKLQLDMTDYSLVSSHNSQASSEVALNIAPKIAQEVITEVLKQVSEMPEVTLKNIAQLQEPKELSESLKQTISALPKEVQQEIQQLIPTILQSSKEFLSVKLLSFVEQRLNIPVTKETSGEEIKSALKNMSSDIKSILANETGAAAQKTVTSLKLSDNTMTFVQIPVQLNEYKTTAEMYVVKRDAKKKLSLEDGIKLVFALNTENLGRIESIISANSKDLNLNIRVENSDIQYAVQKEISYLKTLLSATNFSLSVLKVTTIDKKVSVLNAHTFFGYKQLDITV